ncbi:unnamed protein product [Strongylus vulgaris]|uniref:Uncharacterized protein n=1 Tax=Strongylus vulgaris TaxID=40348 RepID=A0A3P7KB68_STRVU|nr:unnamed protein product [Strongylus vulgaris]
MQQSKFVVVEVTTTTSTMTLIQYLVSSERNAALCACVCSILRFRRLKNKSNPRAFQITNGFDKFAVVSDLSDHPSLKYKVTSSNATSPSQNQQNNGVEKQSASSASATATDRNGKPKASINEIASALSKKYSPSQSKNGFCGVSACVRCDRVLQKTGKHAMIEICVMHTYD